MSAQHVMIDDRILGTRYPLRMFSEEEWRCLHYHYRASSWTNGTSIWGHKSFKKHGPCTLKRYNVIIRKFSGLGLMSVDYSRPTQHVKTMYIAPVGWNDEKPIYPTGSSTPFSGINIKKSHTHFTQVPRPVYMKGLSELDSDSRRLLLTLYHYSRPILRGVDPNAVCVVRGEFQVSRRLAFNMGIGALDIVKMLEELEEKGYICYRNTVIRTEEIDMDRRLVSSAANFGPDQQVVLKAPDMTQRETDRGRPPDLNIVKAAAEILAGSRGEVGSP